jgi:uncharacterized protein YqeY
MKSDLQAAMKDAMKARDKGRVDTIRGILAAIQYEEMEKKTEALQREMKKRREEVEFAEKGGRADLLPKLQEEIKVIESFLPSQLSPEKLESLLQEMKAKTPGLQMGLAMKDLKEKWAGQYDARIASELAKKIFA